MNKEEIIINDINVCDCNAYKDKHCKNETSIMFTEYNLCSNFPDCYYKQLQKLKEENAGLRSLLDFEIQKKEVQSDYPILASNYTVQKYYTDKEYEKLKEEKEKLKEENVEINEEDLINIIAKWKNQKEFDINAGIDYYKFLEKYKKESEDEK